MEFSSDAKVLPEAPSGECAKWLRFEVGSLADVTAFGRTEAASVLSE